ncbi:hypothetical protein [Paenibacillus hubeiensis]|uniref:hypothetical protein n=1 Tax=Paenibacillus hubeiensis TaxID=3077330 RepID=UPI0031BAFF6A
MTDHDYEFELIELNEDPHYVEPKKKNVDAIPVIEIAEAILFGPTLDILYLFAENDEHQLYKAAIVQAFVDADQREGTKSTTYRATVDIAVAKLEGARFLSSYKAGQKEMYFLTDYGKKACSLLESIFIKNPDIKRGTMLINF